MSASADIPIAEGSDVLRFTPDAVRTAEYFFEVQSGFYKGTCHRLGAGRHVIGCAPGADLLLLEPSLAEAHAAFVLSAGLIRVEGLAEGVSVEGVGHVPPGSARTVPLPAAVDVGDIRVVWAQDDLSAGSSMPGVSRTLAPRAVVAWFLLLRRSWTASYPLDGRSTAEALHELMRRPAVPAVLAAAVLAISVWRTVVDPKMRAPQPERAVESVTAEIDRARGAKTAPSEVEASASDRSEPAVFRAAAAPVDPAVRATGTGVPSPMGVGANSAVAHWAVGILADEVRRAGLLNVRVTLNGATVVATGSVEPAMTKSWTALQQSFDERFRGDAPLINSVVERAEKLPAALNIEGVWRGRNPYIVVAGQRYALGARLDGGWSIREIEWDRVILEHDGRLAAMRY